MAKLSPSAQAVLDAYQFAPLEDELTAAAVLRAAAKLMVLGPSANSQMGALLSCKEQLIELAEELESQSA